jgi:aspartate kinase
MVVIHLTVRGAAGLRSISDGLNDLFARRGIAVQFVQARPDGVSFAVGNCANLPELLRGIDSAVQVTVEEGMAIVSLVGDGITAGNEVMARTHSALKHADIRMTAQGSSRLSISLAIPETGLGAAVEQLHREFFRTPTTEIFAVTPESEWRAKVAGEFAGQGGVGLGPIEGVAVPI